jgi:serine/threonine-protein kinase
MAAQLHDPAPRPSRAGTPEEFDRVVARALGKHPDERYPSAGDLGRAALAAARGEPVTESERSVARGPAAPDAAETRVMNGRGTNGAATAATRHRTAATRLEAPAQHRAPASPLARRALAALAVLVALAGLGVALGALFGGGGGGGSPGPLSADEVRGAAQAFADAYSHEDAAALRRTLAKDVLRVLPSGVARGRQAVVAQYTRQFDGKVRDYSLSGLEVTAGTAGRASGNYRVDRDGGPPIQGRIVFGVVRDHGRARIRLIAATPKG